jgi:ClpP class serine protease
MLTTGIETTAAGLAWPAVQRIGRHGELALVEFRGDADEAAYDELASLCPLLEDNRNVHAVTLVIDTLSAAWPSAAAVRCAGALLRLRRAKPVTAYIENALGAGYLLASCCNTVYARPAARFGLLAGCDEASTTALAVQVANARPQVELASLDDLAERVVSSEQAETLRMVDSLCPTLERLLATMFVELPSGEVTLPFRVVVAGLTAILVVSNGGAR